MFLMHFTKISLYADILWDAYFYASQTGGLMLLSWTCNLLFCHLLCCFFCLCYAPIYCTTEDSTYIILFYLMTWLVSLIEIRLSEQSVPAECDIRSCLNTLQFLNKKREALNIVSELMEIPTCWLMLLFNGYSIHF
jgi:hypothetical protein